MLARVARARNGRLAIDWISRRQMPRWRMLLVDGQHYDRQRLRRLLARAREAQPRLPGATRRLTRAETEAALDPNPWRLFG